MSKKMIVRFTGVNEQLFFKRNDENGLFGQTLIKVRTTKGLSQAELGRICFFDRSNMAKIEGGRANVTLYTMIKIASALDISLSELLNGFENKK